MTSKTPLSNLAKLPQVSDNWYVAVRKLRHWMENEEGEIVRPFLLVGVSMESGMVLVNGMAEAFPSMEKVRDLLFNAMVEPPKLAGYQPARPQGVFFEQPSLAEALAPSLEEIGIKSEHKDLSAHLADLIKDLEAMLKGGEEEFPGILSGEGVTPQLVADVFSAAAEFYRAEPWIHLADSQPLAVEFPESKETLFVQLMGNAGVDYGFAAYRRWEDLLHVYEAADNLGERIPSGGWISFSFAEPHFLPFADLDAIERHGWEIAGKDAYPLPAAYYPDHLERLDADLLSLFNGVLRAVPAFVKKHLKSDGKGNYNPVEKKIVVPTYAGPVKMRVRYPAGDLPKSIFPARDVGWLPDEEDGDELLAFDRRAMEGDMAKMFGGFDGGLKDPALKKAQKLMYKAWDEQNSAKRINMAHQALSISPDCADAYVLLAEEEADTLQRSAELYAKGVEAGERALGEKFFEENEGYFWGLLATRPYMRAREGLANCLWSLGELEEAKQHFEELLRLNPDDNQGIRYSLLNIFLETRAYRDVAALLKEYDGDWSPAWLYTKALLAFRQHGDSPEANAALEEALEQNAYVPVYLTGEKRIPNRLPAYITVGGEDEAVSYASGHLNHWRRTPAAIKWLRSRTQTKAEKETKPKKRRKRHRPESSG
ncbi:MAG: tetratricopeptide repeat protein [Chloroflexi bacterium]|nr:tetratricopeptide repeat protein [Chloroflexota bacterium]